MCLLDLKNEERSSPKETEFLCVAWVLIKIILVLGNKYWFWLKKGVNKQKVFPEGGWLLCTFKGRSNWSSLKGAKARSPGPVSPAPLWFAMSPFCVSSYEDLGLLNKFVQLVVETAKSRFIRLWCWGQKRKDHLSSLRVKDSWEESLIGLGGVMWSSFIVRS